MRKAKVKADGIRNYIKIREPFNERTWRHVWCEVKKGKVLYYEQLFAYNDKKEAEYLPVQQITNEREIEDLVWFHQRYYPDGQRV